MRGGVGSSQQVVIAVRGGVGSQSVSGDSCAGDRWFSQIFLRYLTNYRYSHGNHEKKIILRGSEKMSL